MKEENSDNETKENNSTCPPIDLRVHKNSSKPSEIFEKRSEKNE